MSEAESRALKREWANLVEEEKKLDAMERNFWDQLISVDLDMEDFKEKVRKQ